VVIQANLCYLEGQWTNSDNNGAIDEPFLSERHSIDAESFFDLQVSGFTNCQPYKLEGFIMQHFNSFQILFLLLLQLIYPTFFKGEIAI